VLERYNADLANDIGNLGHRGLSMVGRWLGGVVPERAAPDPGLVEVARRVVGASAAAWDRLDFKEALDGVSELVDAVNKHIETRAPWALSKAGEQEKLRAVLRDVLEVTALAWVLLLPAMPEKGATLLQRLGLGDPAAVLASWRAGERLLDVLTPGTKLTVGEPLFPRFTELPAPIAALVQPPSEEPAVSDLPLPEMHWIEYEDFAKLALRVGKVLEAAPHPNGDKLLVLKVDVGEARPRTICAGIRAVFAPESLVGRTVVVVANLKPRVLRGVPSEGMILAAGGEIVTDLVTANAKPGDTVR
jgi:methionyl-tRNA synthetase